MKNILKLSLSMLLGLVFATSTVPAQTDGRAKLETTILDYPGDSSQEHWTVVWVTTEGGTFIKTLRRQGPVFTSTHWGSHCKFWNDARGGSASGSQSLDGYSSATAFNYSGTNSPIILTWNCRDASGNLMPDGNYKFWVQYAEDAGQGPYTTSGLLWTKGNNGTITNNYVNQGANFSNMRVIWTPSTPSTVPPTITSAAPAGTATVGVAYNHTCAASGTAPIGFTATGLPAGMTISTSGVISGTPTIAGTFPGTITATNGTLPNATQAFSIVVSVVPASITGTALEGNKLILSGNGPANGAYTVMTSAEANPIGAAWTASGNGTFNGSGQFRFTNAISAGEPRKFYKLKIP